MIDDHRHRILQAAARVYTQHGWRGATTRRIAEEAGVNEVTLFRHFGSKDALLEQMVRDLAAEKDQLRLPGTPANPPLELFTWAKAHHAQTCGRRPMIRQMMSDFEERPDLVPCATEGPNAAAMQLRHYVGELTRSGLVPRAEVVPPSEVDAAITMFMGAVFADGMNRDVMPAMFTLPVDESLQAYVRLFLRGLGLHPEPALSAARTAIGAPTSTSLPE